MAASGTENERIENRLRSIEGWSVRDSQNRNPASTATPNAIHAYVAGSLHPASWMPYTRASRPTIDRTRPSGSSRPGCGLRDSGTLARIPPIPMAMIGMLIRNTEPHQKCSSRKPPSSGPSATAPPTAAAQIPIALPRSAGGKITVMIDSVTGRTDAPPTPMSPRAMMSCNGVWANALSRDAAANRTRPMIRILRRP